MQMIDRRRLFFVLLGLTAVFAGIGGKLFWIQVAAARDYSARNIDLVGNSVFQRQRGLVLDSGRGRFVDRSGAALTGEVRKGVLVFPVREGYGGSEAQRRKLLEVLHASGAQWEAFAAALKEPAWWPDGRGEPLALTAQQAAQIGALQLPNVQVAELTVRYPPQMPARQLIGYVGQNPQRIESVFRDQLSKGKLHLDSEIGASGLEKTFEPWLRSLGPTTISYFTDAGKRPLPGLGTRVVSAETAYYPLTVHTTLDAGLQRSIEQRMDKLGVRSGAVVVLDAASADVLAMASRPAYDPTDVDLQAGGWSNKALAQTVPGSIFKTVVAAAALEAGVVRANETFDCEGELGKYGFRCWYAPGHGRITLEQAFAESCNITFAKVMMRLNAAQVEDAARKLGLLAPVGWQGKLEGKPWAQFDAEAGGQLFAPGTPQSDEGALIQTAIGQRDVRVTPLQAANLVVSLLHGGEVMSPRVVTDITLKDGKRLQSFPPHTLVNKGDGISPATARKLLAWMREVVETGTGTSLLQAKWPLAGKSGTAQLTTGPKPTDNEWFIGYAPADKPKYAIAVLAAGVPSGAANEALPLFRAVADVMAAAAQAKP
jgi:cell division protein FtsI/penicillin-binding protein 2